MASIGTKHRRRKPPSGPKFIQVYANLKRSQAWHDLGLSARCALIELIDRYNGSNNGKIGLGVRELAYELKCSHATAGRALRELDDANLARPLKAGAWRGRLATEWRLTFKKCDVTGELPVRWWPPRQSHVESAEVSPRKRKGFPSLMSKAQKPKSSMNDPSPSLTTKAHIDIYQVATELGERPAWTKPTIS